MENPELNNVNEWIVKPIVRADFLAKARRILAEVLRQGLSEEDRQKYGQIREEDLKPMTRLSETDAFRETREHIYYGFKYISENRIKNIFTIRFNKTNNGEPIFEIDSSSGSPVKSFF